MKITEMLKEEFILGELKAKNKRDVLAEITGVFAKEKGKFDSEAMLQALLEREKLGSTGIGDGVAIPHGKMKGIDHILCAFGRSKKGINFDAVDRKPVHILFLLLAPEEAAGLHIKMLSRISRILRDPSFRTRLIEQDDSGLLYRDIVEEDKKFSG